MKKIILFFHAVCMTACVYATDRVVQENGASGTYASISAAITDAVDGDRILVVNRPGGQAWVENVTITKSLSLLSAQNDIRFLVQGNYDIATTTAGKTISIIGMENVSGSITTSINAPVGARTNVNIIGSVLSAGNVSFDYDNYNLKVASDSILGKITFRYGKILGNYVDYDTSPLTVNTDATVTNDSIWIVGNKISANSHAIYVDNSSSFLYVANNYCKSGSYSVYIANLKNSSSGIHSILNNTFYVTNTSTSSSDYFIRVLGLVSSAIMDVENNLFYTSTTNVYTRYCFSSSTFSSLNFSYNMKGKSTNITWSDNGTNNHSSTIAINTTTGRPTTNEAIDKGNPGKYYYDLDLTRNDVGAYGGSYTLDNFFPLAGGATRVFWMNSPRGVYQGSTATIRAEGFDK